MPFISHWYEVREIVPGSEKTPQRPESFERLIDRHVPEREDAQSDVFARTNALESARLNFQHTRRPTKVVRVCEEVGVLFE